MKVASNLLHDYGYFNGNVTYQVDSTKNPRAIKLTYHVNMGQPYYLDSIRYQGFSPRADSMIQATYKERIIKPGDHFDVTKLNEERQRLVDLFRNNGYYYYRTDFITFLADTLMHPGYVNLKILP